LHDNIEGHIFDVGGLLLDRLGIGSKGPVKLSNPVLIRERIGGERRGSTLLAWLTRQEHEIFIDLGLGNPFGLRGATVPVRHRDGEPRTPNEGGSAAVGATELAKMID
jgi:hypothetical protein